MTRVAFDTNILVYAELDPASDRGARARDLLLRGTRDGVIPAQVFAEFLRVVQRNDASRLPEAMAQVERYAGFYAAPSTSLETIRAASELAVLHHIQTFDALILAAAADAGAAALLSEDMQDGRAIAGLRILNPFNPDNRAAIDALLPA